MNGIGWEVISELMGGGVNGERFEYKRTSLLVSSIRIDLKFNRNFISIIVENLGVDSFV